MQPLRGGNQGSDGAGSWRDWLKEIAKQALLGIISMLISLGATEGFGYLYQTLSEGTPSLVYRGELMLGKKSATFWLGVQNIGSRSAENVKVWIEGMPQGWKIIFQKHGFPEDEFRSCRNAETAPSLEWSEESENYCAVVGSLPSDASIDLVSTAVVENPGSLWILSDRLTYGTTMNSDQGEVAGVEAEWRQIVAEHRLLQNDKSLLNLYRYSFVLVFGGAIFVSTRRKLL